MKHFLFLMLMAICSLASYAHDFEVDGICYNIIKGGCAEVTFKGATAYEIGEYTGSVVIPSSVEYNGVKYPVIRIGEAAFRECYSLTAVEIPNSIESIGKSAFYNGALKTIVIPNSVTSIEDWAFASNNLKSVAIGNSVTNIGSMAFYWNKSLTSIEIPNSVKSIGSSAFDECRALTSISLGNGVTSIGSYAFGNCSALDSVMISDLESWFNIGFGDQLANPLLSAKKLLLNGEIITNLVVPNTVTKIKKYAFYYFTGFNSVTIPNSVRTIEESAFDHNANITSLTIGNSVSSIGMRSFRSCKNLSSLIIGKSVKNIYSSAFSGCSNLETVLCYAENIPNTETEVFQDCYTNHATLIVPKVSLQAYKMTAPWSEFGTFKTVEGSDSENKKCATPSIAFENGELVYVTETEGAQVVSEITDADIKKHYNLRVPLVSTYNIIAYATKSGYEDSEPATATLVWATATFTSDVSSPNKTISIDSTPLLITQSEGDLTISGLQDGEIIKALNLNGTQIATAKAIGNSANLNLSDMKGKVVVLSVSGKSTKVVVK